MKKIKEYLKSGIIEMYVLGLTSEKENTELEKLSLLYPEIKAEIEAASDALLHYPDQHIGPNPDVKAMLMATIDYTERLTQGEAVTFPPLLNENSKKEAFSDWLNREDMFYDTDYGDTYAKIIGHTEKALTAIVWLKIGSPYEVHVNQIEKFLIIEGTCSIITKEKEYQLKPDDYFSIPLHMGHTILVTSDIPCKVILQRVAA